MKSKVYLKVIVEKIIKKPFLKKKKLIFFEKGNSFFDPCVFVKEKTNYLVISNRTDNCIDLFKVNENKSITKLKTILFDKSLKEKSILLNRASLFSFEDKIYIFFTLQINGRSYIYKKNLVDNSNINEQDYFLSPSENYENSSTMNPCVYKIFDDFLLFYSSGETFEPDNICFCKIDNLEKNNIIKYKLNPIFVKGNHYYNFCKVAFGDLLTIDNYFVLFYIGYFNINKAYINIAFCKKQNFPYFIDLENLNPLIGPGKRCRDAVYKPTVVVNGNNLAIYFNGRTRNQESIFVSEFSKNDLLIKINEFIKK